MTGGTGTNSKSRGPYGGRLFRALGFRWIFPIGTLAVPYHPLFLIILLATPLVWLAMTLVSVFSGPGGGGQWVWMIVAGLVLAIPLSIPILNWAFRAFGGLLAQSLFFLTAMVALAGDVAAGREAAAWAALPAGYVLAYLWQRGSGLLRVRRYRRLLSDYVPVCAEGQTLLLPADKTWVAVAALREGLATRAYLTAPSSLGAQLIELIEQADVDGLQALGHKSLPRGWRIEPAGDRHVLIRPGEQPEGPMLQIGMERIGQQRWAQLTRWTIGEGDERQEVVTGAARIVGPAPLIGLFYAVSITGGHSEWFAGFAPRKVRLTVKEAEDPANVLLPLAAVEPRGEDQRAALVAEARAAFRADEERDRTNAAERAEKVRQWQEAGNPTRLVTAHGVAEVTGGADPVRFWREVSADPSRWKAHRATYLVLCAKAGEADREDLRRTLNWLEASIQVRAREAIVAAAKLLAAMDQPLLASDYGRLETLFNSRVLGMVWQLTPDLDMKPLPRKVPRRGEEAGYGLIRSVPELYLKLADLGPDMRDMIGRLVEEALRYGIPLPPELAAIAGPPSATG